MGTPAKAQEEMTEEQEMIAQHKEITGEFGIMSKFLEGKLGKDNSVAQKIGKIHEVFNSFTDEEIVEFSKIMEDMEEEAS